MRLSELNPNDVKPVASPSSGLKLSQLNPEDVKPVAQPEPDAAYKAKATLEGFGQGVAAGYLPQIEAGTERAISGGLGLLGMGPDAADDKLRKQGFNVPEQSYVKSRDQNIARMNKYAQDVPGYYYGGQVGGVLATAPLISKNIARLPGMATSAAGLLGKATQAAASGAIQGAIQNPGDTAGEVNPIQAKERLNNATTGAAIGGGLSVAGSALQKIPSFSKKVSSALTGLSQNDINTYAKATDEVNSLIERSGGDVTEATDLVRSKFQKDLISTRQRFSKQITSALESAPKEATIDATPILDRLQAAKDRLDPVYGSDAIKEIDDIISKVQTKAEDGALSLVDLFKTKEYLQDQGKSAYFKGGQIFSRGKEAQIAAKQAAGESRKILNSLSPEIAEANNRLSIMHNLEDQLNKNMITPGTPDAALLAAGSGGNPRNAKLLQRMGDITGTDALGEAQKLSAAKAFAKAPLLPADTTGKSLTRMATGIGLGSIKGVPGMIAGGLLSSPAVTKGIINTANVVGKGVNAIPGIASAPGLIQTGAIRGMIQPDNKKNKK